MRIYKVNIESKQDGRNWRAVKVAAKSCEDAIRIAKKDFERGESVEDVELLAATDE